MKRKAKRKAPQTYREYGYPNAPKPKKRHRFLHLLVWLAIIGAGLYFLDGLGVTARVAEFFDRRPVICIVSDYDNADIDEYYADMVTASGGKVRWVDASLGDQFNYAYLDDASGIVFTGGEDVDPSLYGEEVLTDTLQLNAVRDNTELQAMAMAEERELPLLGVCRGMQLLNVYRGGTLIQDIPSALPDALTHRDPLEQSFVYHDIAIDPSSHLSDWIDFAGSVEVNSWHHQAVDALGEGLVASAQASDGIVEAIEDPDLPFFIGVEFHPERLAQSHEVSLPLFRALVDAADAYRRSH